MSEELLRQLRLLEEDYPDSPPVAQQADLKEINQIRSQLGMPLVDARLHELGSAVAETVPQEVKPVFGENTLLESRAKQDHTEARKIYHAYLKKIETLIPHQEYADRVAAATAGRGQTPVRPLATMGTDGGPLLCDHCEKPMVLEGGHFHNVTADVAWKKHPKDNWTSWILGGMVVEIQTNGTLRVYHGYQGRNSHHCCNVADRENQQAQAQFDSRERTEKMLSLLAFIRHEFPELNETQQDELLNQILNVMFSYDPGIGINRPE